MGYTEITKFLIQAGADVNKQDTVDGSTPPLHSAVNYEDSVEIIQLLLQAGANINIKDKTGIRCCSLL